jgi:aldehyde dehydrogenase (NAD+)
MTLHTKPAPDVVAEAQALLGRLGVTPRLAAAAGAATLACRTPITGEIIANVRTAGADEAAKAIDAADGAFLAWRSVPAPRRGELVRLLGEELRAAKADLGRLVTLEAGKTVSEGQGEVQEMIDICDYAVGLSRQLFGLTLATERPDHRMMETWRPLGVVGIITAFNFPVAVWRGTQRWRWCAAIPSSGNPRRRRRSPRWRCRRCSIGRRHGSATRRTAFRRS